MVSRGWIKLKIPIDKVSSSKNSQRKWGSAKGKSWIYVVVILPSLGDYWTLCKKENADSIRNINFVFHVGCHGFFFPIINYHKEELCRSIKLYIPCWRPRFWMMMIWASYDLFKIWYFVYHSHLLSKKILTIYFLLPCANGEKAKLHLIFIYFTIFFQCIPCIHSTWNIMLLLFFYYSQGW